MFKNFVRYLRAVSVGLAFTVSAPVLAQTAPADAVGETSPPPHTFGGDPIAFVAHGELFDADGKIIKPRAEFIRETMDFYIDRLLRTADDKTRAEYDRYRDLLAERFGTDDMTPRFLLLELLSNGADPRDQALLSVRNHVLRKHWYVQLMGLERYRKDIDPRTHLPPDAVKFGTDQGIILKATDASGREYIAECRRADVPIPPKWNGGDWDYAGDLATNFLGFGDPTQVWRADSESPEGLCVALPRFETDELISALGIICLGTESSNACFYDAEWVGKDDTIEPEDLISGADLSNGVCTDCHAGENPYIVHPGGPLDMWPDNRPQQWHTPLIKPIWPQNPGPFGLLDLVDINPLPPDSDASCLDCHNQAGNGRFPDVLALNAWRAGYDGRRSRYCARILEQAVGSTMPGLGSAHDTHAQAMLAFCRQNPPPPGEVPPPDIKDDPEVLGPPIVIGPLYACAEAVEVSGASYDAKLTVRIDGTDVAGLTVKEPSQTIVPVPPLVAGQVVTAVQEENGVVSAESQPETVIDHTMAYPNGLPVPEIDPTLIHECGRTIAVRHVRGATVTVFTNGADGATYSTGGDWTNLPPAIRPFNLGDRYSAQQSMCTDMSDVSGEDVAVAPPAPMPVPTIDPDPPVAGQEIIGLYSLPNGALTTVSESAAGQLTQFATAVDWNPEVDIASGLGHPLQPGEQISVVSELCDTTKVAFPDARPCEKLDAPRIAQPFVGDTAVIVTDAVPGAHVIVFDAGLNEIGDSAGSPIGLMRALVVGDVLIVIQKLGECTSASAYQVTVICASLEDRCG